MNLLIIYIYYQFTLKYILAYIAYEILTTNKIELEYIIYEYMIYILTNFPFEIEYKYYFVGWNLHYLPCCYATAKCILYYSRYIFVIFRSSNDDNII